MKHQIIVQERPLNLASGIVHMTNRQAVRRLHNVKIVGAAVPMAHYHEPEKANDVHAYQIMKPIQFKVDEVLEYEGTCLPKGYMGPEPRNPTLVNPPSLADRPAPGQYDENFAFEPDDKEDAGSSTPESGSKPVKKGKSKKGKSKK